MTEATDLLASTNGSPVSTNYPTNGPKEKPDEPNYDRNDTNNFHKVAYGTSTVLRILWIMSSWLMFSASAS